MYTIQTQNGFLKILPLQKDKYSKNRPLKNIKVRERISKSLKNNI
jgi:hypothetical protein